MTESGKKPPLDQVVANAEARRNSSDNLTSQKVDNAVQEREKDNKSVSVAHT